MRERANGYYAPISYFLAKVLFDIIPLRVIPPFILGSIVYGLAGLNPEVSSFWKFIMTLVLFNLCASSIVLFISVAVSDGGVASLLGSLVMLYKWVVSSFTYPPSTIPTPLTSPIITRSFCSRGSALRPVLTPASSSQAC